MSRGLNVIAVAYASHAV